MNESDWTNLFQKIALPELYTRLYTESIREAYILSKKVDRKVGEMRSAQRAFLVAIIFMVAMLLCAVYSML